MVNIHVVFIYLSAYLILTADPHSLVNILFNYILSVFGYTYIKYITWDTRTSTSNTKYRVSITIKYTIIIINIKPHLYSTLLLAFILFKRALQIRMHVLVYTYVRTCPNSIMTHLKLITAT